MFLTQKKKIMVFLEFEKPLESLYEQLDNLKEVGEKGDIDVSDKIKELRSHIMRWKLRMMNTFSGCIFVQRLKQHYIVHYYCNPSCTIEIKSSQVNAINSFYNSKWQSACSSISIALHCTFAPFDSYSLYLPVLPLVAGQGGL